MFEILNKQVKGAGGKICVLFLTLFLESINLSAQKWNALPGKFQNSNSAHVMYSDSNYIYVGGYFDKVGGQHMKGIARWNGIKWDSMGKGIDGLDTLNSYPNNTLAITTYNSKLCVGGVFSSLGNVQAVSIGTWNGASWDSLSVQPFKKNYYFNGVIAMSVVKNKLYIGGWFDSIAGFPCNGIAVWNDTNWKSLNFPDYGVNNFNCISAICEYKGSIYAGGTFYDSIPSDSTANILRWDSTGWHSVGVGIKGNAVGVESMVVYNGELYVAGYFFKSDGNAGDFIQRWDGISWHGVGGGTGGGNGQIHHLLVYNSKLYAMGVFQIAGGVQANRIAKWDGTNWCSLGSKFDNGIGTGCVYKDSLYIGGGFWTIDGDSISYIAKWIGGNYVDSCGNDASGINQLKFENEKVQVYPNPNNGNMTFQFSQPLNGEMVIYNITGQRITQTTVIAEQLEINLQNQPNGVYFYKIFSKEDALIISGKFVIER